MVCACCCARDITDVAEVIREQIRMPTAVSEAKPSLKYRLRLCRPKFPCISAGISAGWTEKPAAKRHHNHTPHHTSCRLLCSSRLASRRRRPRVLPAQGVHLHRPGIQRTRRGCMIRLETWPLTACTCSGSGPQAQGRLHSPSVSLRRVHAQQHVALRSGPLASAVVLHFPLLIHQVAANCNHTNSAAITE